MQTLAGKRALVTGGASGIGKAIAERLAAAGAELVLVDLNEAALCEAAADFERRGTRVRTYVLDVTDTSRITGLKEQVARDLGPIDVLVNNAGLVFGGGFLDMPLEKHLTTYRVNTLGLVAMTHAFLPDLIAGSDGHVVNVASASGYIGLPFGATYASSKWAVLGFSESLALELELQGHRHVHVTVDLPELRIDGPVRRRQGAALHPPADRRPRGGSDGPRRAREQAVRAHAVARPDHSGSEGVAPVAAVQPRRGVVLGVNTSMMRWRGHGPRP